MSDFSQRFTYVFTAGGVGPTHDDMTFEGNAVPCQITYYTVYKMSTDWLLNIEKETDAMWKLKA